MCAESGSGGEMQNLAGHMYLHLIIILIFIDMPTFITDGKERGKILTNWWKLYLLLLAIILHKAIIFLYLNFYYLADRVQNLLRKSILYSYDLIVNNHFSNIYSLMSPIILQNCLVDRNMLLFFAYKHCIENQQIGGIQM